jgi:hypothetical protein
LDDLTPANALPEICHMRSAGFHCGFGLPLKICPFCRFGLLARVLLLFGHPAETATVLIKLLLRDVEHLTLTAWTPKRVL